MITNLRSNGRPKKRTILPATQANVGFEMEYRRLLHKLIERMHDDFDKAIRRSFKENEPLTMAEDALPAKELRDTIRALAKKWNNNWNDVAYEFSKHYAKKIGERVDGNLKHVLKEHGVTIKFVMSRAQRDVMAATIAANVALIKSIPHEYLEDVEGAVMRSFQMGHDLHTLSKGLQKTYGLTKKRASLISRDQTIKATSAFVRQRRLELGIERAVWIHSHAGKEPRPTHIAMHNQEYDIAKGMWDPDPRVRAYIQPGQLINCRCTSRPIIKGFI